MDERVKDELAVRNRIKKLKEQGHSDKYIAKIIGEEFNKEHTGSIIKIKKEESSDGTV